MSFEFALGVTHDLGDVERADEEPEEEPVRSQDVQDGSSGLAHHVVRQRWQEETEQCVGQFRLVRDLLKFVPF